MGSSGTVSRGVDSSVGSIVWVRRRNGSWWPGKILGSDELSVSHLTSPRSGTPVKLLGREDASVDWYNLEKSKRVKTFRCGEFDQCISRAEASRGLPPKKREKYAHREDAILHALELEKQLLEKKYGKLGCSQNNKQNGSPDAFGKDLVVSSNYLEKGGAKQLNCKFNKDFGIHGSSVEMDTKDHDFDKDRVQKAYLMTGDGDYFSTLNNSRKLKGCGHMTSVEQVYLPSEAPNESPAPTSNNTVHESPGGGTSILDVKSNSLFKKQDKQPPLVEVLQNSSEPNMDVSTSVSREQEGGAIHHTKRSRYTYVTANSGGSPTYNRNHAQVVTPTIKLTPGNSANPCEDSTSDSAEDTETDSSDSQTTESDIEGGLSDDAASIELEPKYPGSIGTYADYGSVSSEDYDVTLNHGVSNSYYDKPVLASEGASRWQLRRKRNNDSIMKRSLDPADRIPFGGSYKDYFAETRYTGFNDSDHVKKSSRAQLLGYGSRGFDSTRQGLHNSVKLGANQTVTKGYGEDANEFFGPAYTGRRQLERKSLLIDVDLEVKASYQRPQVPFISLTSKMSGHAIVGHPVQIEFLENGSSDSFFAAIDEFYPEVSDYSTAVGPVWRTGRRTANSRVPRSQPHSYPTPDLDGDESAVNIQVGVYHAGKVSFGKPKIGALGHSASIMKNNIANSPLDKRYSRKQPKKNGLSCNKKVRTLSSLTSEQNQSSNPTCGGNMYLGSGLIKPDSVLKAVPCIPVKLVFSRLHEELFGRHQ